MRFQQGVDESPTSLPISATDRDASRWSTASIFRSIASITAPQEPYGLVSDRTQARPNAKSHGGACTPARAPWDSRSASRLQRLENWNERRALALPYFLRSTTRESRVRNPPRLSELRSSGS